MTLNDIKYNTPIEVSQVAYNILCNQFAGIVAHRIDENGKLWIKEWGGRKKGILKVINSHPL